MTSHEGKICPITIRHIGLFVNYGMELWNIEKVVRTLVDESTMWLDIVTQELKLNLTELLEVDRRIKLRYLSKSDKKHCCEVQKYWLQVFLFNTWGTEVIALTDPTRDLFQSVFASEGMSRVVIAPTHPDVAQSHVPADTEHWSNIWFLPAMLLSILFRRQLDVFASTSSSSSSSRD